MKEKLFAISDNLEGKDIKSIRKKLNLTQAEFAQLGNVSVKTIERWERGEKPVTGPVVTLVKILREYPQIQEELKIPVKTCRMRLWYMYYNEVCTLIDVEERERRVEIYNYTKDYTLRAFGKKEKPTFEEYEEFLESRCFQRCRFTFL